MPVIQGSPYQPNIQVGSPVGYGDEESAGLRGRAMAGFGNALSNIGEMLTEATNRKNREADTYEAKIKVEEYNLQLDKAIESKSYFDQNNTASETEQFEAFARNLQQETLGAVPKSTQGLFKLETLQSLGSSRNKLAAGLAKEAVARTKQRQEEYINMFAGRAAVTPESYSSLGDKAELSIRENQNIDAGTKETMVREARKNIIVGAIEGLKNRGQNGITLKDYETAKSILQREASSGLLDPKEMDKLNRDLFDARRSALNFKISLENESEKIEKRLDKKMNREMVDTLYAEMDSARSAEEQQAVYTKAKLLRVDGKLTGQALEQFLAYKPGVQSNNSVKATQEFFQILAGDQTTINKVRDYHNIDENSPAEVAREFLYKKQAVGDINPAEKKVRQDFISKAQGSIAEIQQLNKSVDELSKKMQGPGKEAKVSAAITKGMRAIMDGKPLSTQELFDSVGYVKKTWKDYPKYHNYDTAKFSGEVKELSSALSKAPAQEKGKIKKQLEEIMDAYEAFKTQKDMTNGK